MASTYTPTTEDSAHTGKAYFQNVEISPATLKDGTLRGAFDTKVYPSKGIISDPTAGITAVVAAASSLTPVHAVSVTLTATVTGPGGRVPSGTVTFKDGATTLLTAATLSAGGVATLVVAAGFTAAAHVITAVYSGDARNPPTTSAPITITAS